MFDINILSCISIDTSEICEVVFEDEINDMVSIMVKTRPIEKFLLILILNFVFHYQILYLDFYIFYLVLL